MKFQRMGVNQQGSFAVEAVLLMSAVLIALFLLCFSFMLMYHRVLLTKAAAEIAELAANDWTRENNPYYRVFEIIGGEKAVEKTIAGAIDQKKLQGAFPEAQITPVGVEQMLAVVLKNTFPQLVRWLREPEKTTVKVSYQGGLILRKIQVEITQEVRIPFGRWKKLFDGKATATLYAESSAVITEPAEMIRNVDLAIEYASKAKEKFDFSALMGKVQKAATPKEQKQ